MTYSIVAADPERGLLGIAAQSHHFGVGPAVVAMRSGVGVMAVQSYADIEHYRQRVFEALESDIAVDVALGEAFDADPRGRRAQVGVVAADGSAAAITGSACVEAAGHLAGQSFAFQANMCARPEIWEEGAAAYVQADGDMPTRLLASLSAAEAAGGDLRGSQSAVLRVLASKGESGAPSEADLRVDDHPDPVAELRRLDSVRRAAAAMNEAFAVAASGDVDAAISQLQAAQIVFGNNLEPTAWAAVLLARSRRFEEAKALARNAIESHAGWAEFLSRLPAAALLPDDTETLDMLKELGNV